jgi:hypothetical protein
MPEFLLRSMRKELPSSVAKKVTYAEMVSTWSLVAGQIGAFKHPV